MPADNKKHHPAKKMNSKSDHHASGSPAKLNNHHDAIVKPVATPSAKIASYTFSPSPSVVPSSIPSMSILQSAASTPSSVGMAGEQSSTPVPVSPSSSSPSSSASIIGSVLGGIIICLSIVIYALYRRIKKRKEHQRHKGMLTNCTDPSRNGGWNVTRSWSTLDTNNSSSKCVTSPSDMNSPPPAYYCSTRANKKRWTQDSVISKQSSFVKQYSPQLAYSPSQSTILQMDHEGVSPSHTLVDTSGSSWLHQKDNLSLPEYEDDQQQRRSIQPYQAQLDISSSFSDALDPPGPYHSGILLHTHPSSTS